jgi:PTS system glucitol/sorbitol-specific IIA component
MNQYFHSDITSVGVDASEMVDGGVVIFFGEPCPSELAEVSIVHKTIILDPQRDPQVGDVLRVGGSSVTVTAVGSRAAENLRTLGHIVVYVDPEDGAAVLPGAVHATGAIVLPQPGETIEFIAGGA